jgi:NAD(P)-dependent dehydrogenase (short-subunit alcohol dehydrogenase family)
MGLTTPRAFADAGAAVALADRDVDAAHPAAEELSAAGRRAIGSGCDVADESQVAAMIDQPAATFGRLDMAFNNAGIQVPPSDRADETAENFGGRRRMSRAAGVGWALAPGDLGGSGHLQRRARPPAPLGGIERRGVAAR